MSKIEQLQQEIADLTPEQLAAFDKWYAEYKADAWDRQIEADSLAGKLDKLAEKALAEHRAGRSRPL